MKRRIFIGSSTEGLAKAKQILAALSESDDIECVLWTDVFQPGFLTFQVLEKMLRQCCAAVYVASPDDDSTIRGSAVKSPRANVILEFGLVTGRLGLQNVALCQYGGAVLPSDLDGLTVIAINDSSGDAAELPPHAITQLKVWGASVSATADTIPRTQLVHGYTGKWQFQLELEKWRDLEIVKPGYAQINGELDLVIALDGQSGSGRTQGRLWFDLPNGPSGSDNYQGEFRTAHEITNVVCLKDGSLHFITEAFAVQKVSGVSGTPPPQLQMDHPTPWSSKWELSVGSEPRSLEGSVRTTGSVVSLGRARATLVSEFF